MVKSVPTPPTYRRSGSDANCDSGFPAADSGPKHTKSESSSSQFFVSSIFKTCCGNLHAPQSASRCNQAIDMRTRGTIADDDISTVLGGNCNGRILQQHNAQLGPEPLKSCANVRNLRNIAAEINRKQVVKLSFENLLGLFHAASPG